MLADNRIAAAGPARIVDAMTLPAYDFGPGHPFARDRMAPLFDLLHSSGLLDQGDFLPTAPATIEQLASVHAPDYIAALQATSAARPSAEARAEGFEYGLGTPDNPIGPGQHAAAAAVAGATLACVDAVLTGRCRAAFQPAGGLHHAMPQRAAGFCLYNDVALAIRAARVRGVARVLYVDFDVHHGDGVEWIFRSDPTVLTFSCHETPEVRYPGTGRVEDRGEGPGRGFALNLPLQPGTDDASWIECVEAVLAPAARAFRPELIVSQHGCDGHRDDPLATLELTTRASHRAAELTRRLADELCQGRWVATGGGGYQPVRVLPRAFALVWAVLAGRSDRLPAVVDPGWCRRWAAHAGGTLPTEWFDPPQPTGANEAARRRNRETVARLRELAPECSER